MKKIRWKHHESIATVSIGCVEMDCYKHYTINRRIRWYARVFVHEQMLKAKCGPMRHSLDRAKEDAVLLAGEMLLDYHAGLKLEMANFDLVE